MDNEVSVLIPAHNEERTLELCLKSILNQKYIKEIILVADRCTDKTVEIAKKYKIRILIKNFKKWSNPRAETINFGIDEINGKFTFICDADIYLTKNFMEKMIKNMKNPKVGIISGISISNGLFRVPLSKFFLGGCRLIRTDLLKEVKCKDMIGFDTFQDLSIEKKGYKIIVHKKAIAYEMRQFKISNYIKQGLRRGQAKYQTSTPFALTLLHIIFNFFKNPFTFPELIAILIGFLRARLNNLPQYKSVRKLMIQRQIERILNSISKIL